jgi:salicylate hydroxylase
LRHHGIDYVVLEQAPELTEVGAGLQLSPNGVRVLEWLGLREILRSFCVEPRAHRFQDWQTGELLLTLPLQPDVENEFGYPYFHAHRCDLLGAMVERLAFDRVQLNAKVASVSQGASSVEARLANGRVEKGDVLIGADGIHSLVRDQVFSPDPPAFAGYSVWRGLVPAERAKHLGIERYSYIWLGRAQSMVLYYISGGRLINWVGFGRSRHATRESWSARGRSGDLLAEFQGWHPQVRGLIEITQDPLITQLHDRNPLARWVDGRIALLGDAAHAMLPYHAQGAVQSIEDAWVLASVLAQAGGAAEAPAALTRYEALRKERARLVQQQSRNGQEWYHLSDDAAIASRNARYRKLQASGGEKGFSPAQRWLYAYDAEKAARGEDAEWRAMGWRG